MTTSKWLTAAQAAELLGIGRARLRNSNLLFVKVGRTRYYRRSVVEAYRPTAAQNRRAETTSRNRTTHPRYVDSAGNSRALTSHPLYGTWRGMMDRCCTGRTDRWDRYGGRGIQVYKPWHNLATFIREILALLGPRPLGETLDRYPDPDGNYEPGNVKWSTPKEQAANRGSIVDLPFCLCDFDCSSLPALCPFEQVPWATAAVVIREHRQRILESLRIPPLVSHEHTGRYDDCLACVRQDPFDAVSPFGDEFSPREHCAAAAGYTHRRLAPLGLFGL